MREGKRAAWESLFLWAAAAAMLWGVLCCMPYGRTVSGGSGAADFALDWAASGEGDAQRMDVGKGRILRGNGSRLILEKTLPTSVPEPAGLFLETAREALRIDLDGVQIFEFSDEAAANDFSVYQRHFCIALPENSGGRRIRIELRSLSRTGLFPLTELRLGDYAAMLAERDRRAAPAAALGIALLAAAGLLLLYRLVLRRRGIRCPWLVWLMLFTAGTGAWQIANSGAAELWYINSRLRDTLDLQIKMTATGCLCYFWDRYERPCFGAWVRGVGLFFFALAALHGFSLLTPAGARIRELLLRAYTPLAAVGGLLSLGALELSAKREGRFSRALFACLPVLAGIAVDTLRILILMRNVEVSASAIGIGVGVGLTAVDILSRAAALAAERTEREWMEAQLNAQIAHYDAIRENIEEVRVLRHDMRHHLLAIEALLAAEAFDDARRAVRDLLCAARAPSRRIVSGNPVLDAILSEAAGDAAKRRLRFALTLKVSENMDVDAALWCQLLGNALSNAVRECRAGGELRVVLRRQGDMLFGQVCNDLSPGAWKKPFEPGIGIRSMRSAAQKYGATLYFDRQPDRFTLRFLLPELKRRAPDKSK